MTKKNKCGINLVTNKCVKGLPNSKQCTYDKKLKKCRLKKNNKITKSTINQTLKNKNIIS